MKLGPQEELPGGIAENDTMNGALSRGENDDRVVKTGARYQLRGRKIFGRRKHAHVASSSEVVVLDPDDTGIEEAIQRLERKSFITEGLIPEVQMLLALPPSQAKEAYLAALT